MDLGESARSWELALNTRVITDPPFRVKLTSVKFGDRLAVVNSHLDTGYPVLVENPVSSLDPLIRRIR